MRIAVLTYAFNEAVNLPVWASYYGRIFGHENLYVIDHGSSDGSTANLGEVNIIRVPHTPFDDIGKSIAVSSLYNLLLQHFDCVIISDCDEIIIADPEKYADLKQYVDTMRPVMTAAIGIQIHHLLDREFPINLEMPILSQRRVAYFSVPATKPMIGSVPARWVAGGHAASVRPKIDPAIFVVHTKFMDYAIAANRHRLNAGNEWSESQQASGHGLHHRYGVERFVHEGFLVPMDVFRNKNVQAFQFENEIAAMEAGMTENGGIYNFGHAEPKFVQIPERFATSF